jgi:II/X family phage/plasmid replication protein
MAIDTVKLISPELTEEQAGIIQQACVLRSAVEVASGEVLYSLTTGSLLGSWDSRVSVRIDRERWSVSPEDRLQRRQGQSTRSLVRKNPCAPYVVIEGSVHKAMLGHNLFGGPCELLPACQWLVADVAGRLGVTLPAAQLWEVARVDWAEVYDLGRFVACEEYVSGLNMAQFPRRKVVRYGSESLMSAGTTTALKVYHKGPEFSAHDRKRVSAWLPSEELTALQHRANGILRVEVSIKAKKLQAEFEGKVTVDRVTREWLEEVHDREVARLLKEAEDTMQTVRTHREVSRRLADMYGRRLANTLFGTWMQLAALGEAEVQKTMTKTTWYRQRKYLMDAAISWQGADVHITPRKSALPPGFSPIRSDARRLFEIDPTVREKLGIL